MKSNEQLTNSKKAKAQSRKIIATNSLSVSGEITPETSNQADRVSIRDRELAWKVASSLLISFKYAWAGLTYAFTTQRNFRIHVAIGMLAIGLSIFLHLTRVEIALIGLTIGLVLAMELLNTAIESVVDLTVKQTYHELAKIAKDCAAGAVLVSALVALMVAGSLMIPPLLALIEPLVVSH